MRLLIVTESIGKTATGIVSRRLIEGLSKKCELYILTGYPCPNDFVGENNIYYLKINNHNPYIVLLSFLFFKRNKYEEKLVVEHLASMPQFDLVFSCVSYGHYAALIASNNICKKQRCPHVSYFVDAIPTPFDYVGGSYYLKILSRPLKRFIKKQTQSVSIVYSTCLEMSEYQNRIINNNQIHFDELLNPVPYDSLIRLPRPSKPIFVFAGQVYSPRTPKYVLEAFSLLLKEYPNAELHFIGTKYLKPYLNLLSEETISQIKILDYIEDVKNAYVSACGLIDIGCNVEKDIFMSSKLSGYISYNRPIICETSILSAPRRIFKNDKTVLLCEHNTSQILNAMKKCVEQIDEFDYTERIKIIKTFSIYSVTDMILSDYKKYIAD